MPLTPPFLAVCKQNNATKSGGPFKEVLEFEEYLDDDMWPVSKQVAGVLVR